MSHLLGKRHASVKELLSSGRVSFKKHRLPITESTHQYVREFTPENPDKTVIVGHAMFCRGNYLCSMQSPSLSSFLLEKNCRVFVPDLRSHGKSSPYGSWTVDDLLQDLNALILFVNARSGLPLFLIGHSLSGILYVLHQSLKEGETVNGVVTLGSAPWNKKLIHSVNLSYRMKIFFMAFLIKSLVAIYGHVPARKFKFGSDNECNDVVRQHVLDNYFKSQFLSINREVDYVAAVENLTTPLLCLTSNKDYIACTRHVKAFVKCAKNKQIFIDNRLNHMDLVDFNKNIASWEKMFVWLANHAF